MNPTRSASPLRSFLISGQPLGSTTADSGWLLMRCFAGLALALAHGLGKLPPSDRFVQGVGDMGFPMPGFFAWAAAFAESGGGLLIALGLFTRPAAVFVIINMVVAAVIRQAGDPFTERELAYFYLVFAAAAALVGSGRYGLDALLRSPQR